MWISLSLAAAALTTVASAGGLFLPATYSKETALWAAEGAGQDLVNLVVVVPAVLVSAWFVRRESARARVVWLGLMLYLVYSYCLYAFFVHFNDLFLVYVATLSTSAFAFAGAAIGLDRDEWPALFSSSTGERPLSALLLLTGVAFGALWLSEIVPALLARRVPPSAIDAGLIVNPVHVLDLAFVIPAMIAAGVLLWKRRPVGFVAAVALATFMAAMGLAIVGMTIVVSWRGLGSAGPAVPMSVLVAVTVAFTARLLRVSLPSAATQTALERPR